MAGEQKQFHGHPDFYTILATLAELHSRKNHDYTGKSDPLQNLRECEKAGIPAWKGVIVRLTDKMSRLNSYALKGAFLVEGEGLEDTFMDMAVYSILGIILHRESQKHTDAPRS